MLRYLLPLELHFPNSLKGLALLQCFANLKRSLFLALEQHYAFFIATDHEQVVGAPAAEMEDGIDLGVENEHGAFAEFQAGHGSP